MKKKNYKVTLNFVDIPESEQKERADKVVSILVKAAISNERNKADLGPKSLT